MVEFETIVAVGFKITEEEYRQAHNLIENEDEWDEIFDTYFASLNSYFGSGYIFSNKVKIVHEGQALSMRKFQSQTDLSYETNKEMIDAFNKYFPFIDKNTHQLDLLVANVVW